MLKHLRFFYGSFFVTFIGIVAAIYYVDRPALMVLYLVIILSILEVSLSFDNAVINAKVLAQMPPLWQKLFIWIGIPIAVFGMRLVFPIVLVDLTTNMSLTQVIDAALYNPDSYQKALVDGFPMISSFGAAFLLMVFIRFLLSEHEYRWLKPIEQNAVINYLRELKGAGLTLAIVSGIIFLFIAYCYGLNLYQITMAYLLGILVHEALHVLNHLVGGNVAAGAVRNGLAGFIYLEVLDASFSFDGVIGAFAISTNIIIIMIGLGIGAMFVRSMTLYLVAHKTLNRFRYLEHGAHYAIGFLAIIMLVKIFFHVPEWLTGLVGIGFIVVSVIHSINAQKSEQI
ncbi:DUF475 domain-containing protein [Thiotrichales bacterium 19S9-12]|nr:DUF475 domain-containing protein [Thiotrichales bacterium 19S9-11]MCF6811422.1 DUF475 domain-containing protein [Thiotrichales bacterium 19S9-12]